ncbi:long-chain fatty acid--CoA ligase [Acinetobacter radioresistens]|uniref:long-chain-fatty-acid--CoA ligase n=1 Tax=Acinetobacter radioresistens TaxID=40216 RepID=UPI002002D82C|nr:long-chain fatty acid--CoA ligase [Acinetobacter radioresistens]MCK4088194.1 long-chain fatty acid--CoA ligase [Acinetobacter radioresistens]MCK4109316.1 long-chain fatty acid--CoA ligase [Acinetobacter radioresistens]MCX0331853.1 long-chain fatty acid--CoA ligase [Acinetobacter radioresistens]
MIYAQRPWKKNLPASLQDYQFDSTSIPQNLSELFDKAVHDFSDAAAFSLVLPTGLTKTLSFKQIQYYSDLLARYFQHELQLQPGDVVGLQMPNCLHYPIAVFACWKAGLIITNINPLYTARELEYQLTDSQAKALIVSDMFLATFEKVIAKNNDLKSFALITASLSDFFDAPYQALIAKKIETDAEAQGRSLIPSIDYCSFSQVFKKAEQLPELQSKTTAIALYQYTGGTTGRSKGAIITHQNLLSLVRMTGDYLRAHNSAFNQQDSILTAIPLYHIFAFSVNFLMFFEGGSHNILVPSPRPVSNLRPAFEQFKITWLTGVDTLYAGLLAEDWFVQNPPELTCAISGGTALRPATAEHWKAKIGNIIEGFGMTETSCAAMLHPPISIIRQGSVGFPLPGSEIKIVDVQGNEVPLGSAGELCIKGPHIVQGYLNRPEESADTFVEGWLHTGDIAQLDEDGFCYILDRKKDMVLVSGFNVYPNEIEAVIAEHPDIIEVAVIGVPDVQTGEAVKAYIATRNPSLSTDEILAHCKEHLTAYKVPKVIEILPELPKSTVGKILRAELRNLQQQLQSA